MQLTDKSRDYSMDLLRVVATLMVVLVHVCADSKYSVPVVSGSWLVLECLSGICRIAPILFFMLSGAFNNNTNHKKALKKGLYYILIFFISALAYSAIDSFLNGNHSLYSTITGISDFKYHLWFIPAYAGVTILSPYINLIKDIEKLLYASVILAFFCIFLPSLCMLFPDFQIICIIAELLNGVVSKTMVFICYYIWGKYLYSIKGRFHGCGLMVGIVLSVSVLVSFFITCSLSLAAGSCNESAFDSFSIFTFIGASCIFILFLIINSPDCSKLLDRLVPYLFPVYLIHVFFIEFLARLGFTSMSFGEQAPTVLLCAVCKCIVVFLLSLAAGIPLRSLKSWALKLLNKAVSEK